MNFDFFSELLHKLKIESRKVRIAIYELIIVGYEVRIVWYKHENGKCQNCELTFFPQNWTLCLGIASLYLKIWENKSDLQDKNSHSQDTKWQLPFYPKWVSIYSVLKALH